MTPFVFRIVLVVLVTANLPAAPAEISYLPVIGEIWGSNPATSAPYDNAFREGLRELGYIDGRNVTILARYANGDASQFPRLIKELIALHAKVLLVTASAVLVAKETATSVPIVCVALVDPVRSGLITSLAHPGGNLTGLSEEGRDTDSKRLELAAEMLPGLKRVDLLFEPRPDGRDQRAAVELRTLAGSLGITLRTLQVRDWPEMQAALRTIDRDRPNALLVWSSPLALLYREAIMKFADRKMPVISEGRQMADAGALLTYAPNYYEMYSRAAAFVDKILKGAKAADIPVEQPMKFELIVNLRSAKSLKITVPDSILLRADRIIR